MRTACDVPGPAAPRACAGTGLCRTRRRWLRCSRRLLPARSPACRSRRGRAALARRRVRHPGDQHGQVPVPYSHHAVPTVRGFPVRSLLVTAAGIPAAYAADLVRHMAGRYRPPDALRRADTLPRADPPAAMTARQPDRPGRRAECHERALPRTAATYIAGSGMLSPSRVCRTADIAKIPLLAARRPAVLLGWEQEPSSIAVGTGRVVMPGYCRGPRWPTTTAVLHSVAMAVSMSSLAARRAGPMLASTPAAPVARM